MHVLLLSRVVAHSLVCQLLLLRRFVLAREAVGEALYDVLEVSPTADLPHRRGGGCVSAKVVQQSTVMKLKLIALPHQFSQLTMHTL